MSKLTCILHQCTTPLPHVLITCIVHTTAVYTFPVSCLHYLYATTVYTTPCPVSINWLLIYQSLTGNQHQKRPYSAKTGESARKECYGATVWELHCLRTALCESIRYQAKSEQNVRQDPIPRVRHGEAALCTPVCPVSLHYMYTPSMYTYVEYLEYLYTTPVYASPVQSLDYLYTTPVYTSSHVSKVHVHVTPVPCLDYLYSAAVYPSPVWISLYHTSVHLPSPLSRLSVQGCTPLPTLPRVSVTSVLMEVSHTKVLAKLLDCKIAPNCVGTCMAKTLQGK